MPKNCAIPTMENAQMDGYPWVGEKYSLPLFDKSIQKIQKIKPIISAMPAKATNCSLLSGVYIKFLLCIHCVNVRGNRKETQSQSVLYPFLRHSIFPALYIQRRKKKIKIRKEKLKMFCPLYGWP